MRAAIGIRCVARIIEARLDVDDVRVVVGADAQGQRVAGMTVVVMIAGTPGSRERTSRVASRFTSLQNPLSSATMNPRSRTWGRSTRGQ